MAEISVATLWGTLCAAQREGPSDGAGLLHIGHPTPHTPTPPTHPPWSVLTRRTRLQHALVRGERLSGYMAWHGCRRAVPAVCGAGRVLTPPAGKRLLQLHRRVLGLRRLLGLRARGGRPRRWPQLPAAVDATHA